ncbi:MAG TPA: hypothetical protein VEQ85_11935 [Lacipirellulaceae bacterium]|nr:hypothetical protein [Lacipirellulaceae bacterium]
MHAARNHSLGTSCGALAAACALVGFAMLLALPPNGAAAQQGAPVPVLTVPTCEPPAAAQPTITLDDALSLLQQGGAAPAAPAPSVPPRSNPFAGEAPPADAAAPRQNLLLPFNPSHGDDNVQVRDAADGLVSLMVRNGSLRQVVAMIAETQKLNIVFAGPSDTQVTASFERQPWETVLDALLSATGHTWTTRGDVIFVSSVDVAEFMPPDAGGLQVEVFELDFGSAVDLDQAIKGLLSPAGRSWITESDPADNRRTREAIAVMDYPAHVARIGQYICQADQPPRQVFIQAHILQIELTDDCRNGINFNHVIGLGSADITLKSVGFANSAATSAFLVDANGVGLDGLIELLQNTTDAKTLASPEIHAVSGQASRLQIGEKLPYKVTTTTQTATLETVQMLDVGVVLEVTPRVTRDGRVLMRIKPKVSTGVISPDTGLPSEKTSEVETDVMMASGQGMVIGGLIQGVDSNIQSKIPWLGDIPYLGVVFQKRQVITSRKEIIVTLRPFVLPYSPILQEINEEQVWRTEQPLTQGAICRYPRPYEPRMPDALDHHKAKHAQYVASEGPRFGPFVEPGPHELMSLPPTGEFEGAEIEELPDPQAPPLDPAEPTLK